MCNFNVKNVSTKCLLSLNKTCKVSEYISTIIEYQYYTSFNKINYSILSILNFLAKILVGITSYQKKYVNKIARFQFTKIQQYEMIKHYFNYFISIYNVNQYIP
jgi:hypothetical protein